MTLGELAGIKGAFEDAKTGEPLTFEEAYRRIIDCLGGLDAVAEYIPFTMEELTEAYEKDEHFNTLPLREWDLAAGFTTSTTSCVRIGGGLWNLYSQHKVTCASCSQGVCILKEAARMLVERKKRVSVPFDEVKAEFMKDEEFAKEYNRLAPHYEAVEKQIKEKEKRLK